VFGILGMFQKHLGQSDLGQSTCLLCLHYSLL